MDRGPLQPPPQDQADDHAEQARPGQPRIGQDQGEGQHAQDREPDHVFAPEAVAQRAAGHRAQRHRRQKSEQVQLRVLHRDVEPVDQVEGVVARQARQVDVLREHEHQQDGHPAAHVAIRQPVSGVAQCRGGALDPGVRVPSPDSPGKLGCL